MTQPIQEPSTPRALSQSKWSENQLFRRPPPFMGIRWPWVVLQNPGQTLADSATLSPSLVTDLYWDPTLVNFGPDPLDDLDDVFVVDKLNSGGTDYWTVTNRVEGWFMLEMVHAVEEGAAGSATDYFRQRITIVGGGMAFPDDATIGRAGMWGNTGATEMEVDGHLETYRTIWLPLSQKTLSPQVAQTSGSTKGCGGHLKVWYLGGLGGSTDNADWEVSVA